MSDGYDLGPMQAGMFFQNLLDTGEIDGPRGFDVEQLCVRFLEHLNAEVLASAWALVAQRHGVLRTSFHLDMHGRPSQVVRDEVRVPVTLKDWTGLADQAEQQHELETFLREDRRAGFQLSQVPAMRVTLALLRDGSSLLLWTFHHIILDGRSFAPVLSDVMKAYESIRDGLQVLFPTPPRPYQDYIDWLSTLDLAASRKFFEALLAGKDAPTPLPCAEPSARHLPEEGYGEYVRELPGEQIAALEVLASQTETTLGTIVNAAWALVLSRFTGDTDVVFGSTRACRHSALQGDAAKMVGLFINTLPLRGKLDPERSVADLLGDLRAQSLSLREHEHTQLTEIQSVSQLPRGTALFDTLVMFETQELADTLRATSVRSLAQVETHLFEQPSIPLNVTVFAGTKFEIRILYERKRFRATSIARLGESLQVALAELSREPARPLREVCVLAAPERKRILFDWNRTERAFSDQLRIHEPFELRADRQPDAVAVEMEGAKLTYRELELRANRLAHALRSRGAEPGVYIGVCLERGLDLVVALLGVAKSGAAYVPLDPQYPKERLSFMLSDAGAPVVVTEQRHADLFDSEKLLLDGCSRVLDEAPQTRPPAISAVDDVCYAIFTSGSTGVPKGVVLTHRAVNNTLEWVNRTFEVGPGDRLLFVTSPCFDLSVYDTFGALGAGATVVVASNRQLADPQRLANLITSERITIWDSAPAALQRLVTFLPSHAPDSTLRLVMLSGDWIPVSLPDTMRQVFSRARVISLGGATEAAIWSNWYPVEIVDPTWPSIPYGKPIQNACYHVLDASMQPTPVGVVGDLYIGGACLAQGYLNRPELTSERFVHHPFREGERLYKTGDLARYFEDGNLEFLGRADFQVKIRGYRVEMGEVESVAKTLPQVREAVATALTDASGQKSLALYVVGKADVEIDTNWVKQMLSDRLPDFMVPSYVVVLDAMPLSANGKLDRKALPHPASSAKQARYVAPSDDLERQLVDIWQQLLAHDRIGIHDNFFDLGGHSLLAVTLVARIKTQLGLGVSLAAILKRPTIHALARHLSAPSDAPRSGGYVVPVNGQGSRTPLFIISGAGGYGFVFHRLSVQFGSEQPVYAVQAVGSHRSEDVAERSIEEIAKIYEPEFLGIARGGPVVLAGYSFGALVAFELAQRLLRQGIFVERLISFDGFAPRFPRQLPLHRRLIEHYRALAEAQNDERREYVARRMYNVKRHASCVCSVEIAPKRTSNVATQPRMHTSLGSKPRSGRRSASTLPPSR
ncbi:MAG: amino acid adenylation domain-containing protein [Polyangiaceae bacterium]